MEKIKEINARLDRANLGVKLVQRGDRLALRATFPPKKFSVNKSPHQQWLSLGVYANDAGLAFAETEAYKVGSLLAVKAFSWDMYDQPLTFGEAVDKFQKDYFDRRAKNPKSLTTWRGDYYQILKRLPPEESITEQSIIDLVLSTAPDSRTRKRAVMVLNCFCKFLSLNIDLSRYRGGKTSKVTPRILPDDPLIVAVREKIINPAWRYAFGILASYGLRNHELFNLDFSNFPILKVIDGKTGSRDIFPVFPEWVDQWELKEINLPNCTGKDNASLGNRVTRAFIRQNVPFNPYSLRHRYAVRCLEFGIDSSITARQMGHSLKVHTEIYHQWIDLNVTKNIYLGLINNPDRPKPPKATPDP
jgi:integrase